MHQLDQDIPPGPSCRIGVLSNASNLRKQTRAADLDGMFRCHPRIVHRLTPSEHHIAPALAELAAAEIDVLAINGGDGTVAHVLTALLNQPDWHRQPLLALLPGGTSNIAVGDVGFGGSLHQAALRLCRWANGKQRVVLERRSALRVTTPELPAPLYGLVFGAGAVVDGIDYWHEQVKARGMRGPQSSFVAMLGTLRGIIGRDQRFARPLAVRLAFDGAAPGAPEEALILVVSSLERLFLGVKPFWGGGDATLHSTVIRSRPERFLRLLPWILRGRQHADMRADSGYLSRRTNRLALHMQGRFTLDGDIYSCDATRQALEITSGPELRFLCPR